MPDSTKRGLKIVALIFVGLFIVRFFFVDTDKYDRQVGQSYIASSVESPPTPEQEAEALKNKAKDLFRKDEYNEAFDVCNRIIKEYNQTETAKSIDDFVNNVLSRYEEFEANDLFAEYSENIVNADKLYTDTVLIVTGKVSKIGKTNNDRNLAVLLDCDSFIGCVQLNFSKDFEDEIAELSNGDRIKVIGECSGTSGKLVLFLEGSNVMIENCRILQ